MTSKFDDLVAKLKEIFQLDKPELDFGIYRIMHLRANEIRDFLEKQLAQKVTEALAEKSEAEKRDLEEQLEKAIEGATQAGFPPEASPKVKELRLQLAHLESNSKEAESAVYAHLLAFFSRYYDDGDFISKRRYKEGVYAIPYAGEEVKLHWANADQYYTKSGENFTNYSFTLDGGAKVHFKLITAETAKDNIKDNDAVRYFVLWDPTQKDNLDDERMEDLPDTFLEEKNGELYIYFQFLKFPKKGHDQKTFAVQAREKIFDALGHDLALLQKYNLTAKAPTENDRNRTLFDKHFTTYTAKNTSDYFIHKDLKGFLTRELDFYIKNEMLHLDDLQRADTFKDIERNLRQIQTVRLIATELITFMAQVEDFQKKLWLKKKFVTQCDYCITMDRVPESLKPQILANAAQQAEWKRLGIEKDPKADDLTALDARMVDTKFFDETFKAKLLQAIPDLDDQCDGLLIHSENFQALNLLQERYKEQVKCIYIDPPYNTGNDGFLYRDGYKDSSWLSMIESSMRLASLMTGIDTVLFTSLDYNENFNYRTLLETLHSEYKFTGEIHWESKTKSQNTEDSFNKLQPKVEIIFVHSRKSGRRFNLIKKGRKEYPFSDEKGVYREHIMELMNASGIRGRESMIFPISDGVSTVSPPKGKQWKLGRDQVATYMKADDILIRGDKVIIKMRPQYERVEKTEPFWGFFDKEIGTTESAKKELTRIIPSHKFDTVKPIVAIQRLLYHTTTLTDYVLDYFGGSGTTAHATIALNREDGGKRKYILVEMGDHFETVLKPRVQKVVYAPEWKDGKPKTSHQGISHCFKYMTLESYEDTLNNIELKSPTSNSSDEWDYGMKREYILRYMLDLESRGSIINSDDFRHPFDYQLKIAVDSSGATAPQKVDLVETFNYLIGLRVIQQNRQLEKGYLYEEGTLPNGDLALILWRDCDKVGNEALNDLLSDLHIHPGNTEYQVIYVNGDHAVPNVTLGEAEDGKRLKILQIENVFLEKMFAEAQ